MGLFKKYVFLEEKEQTTIRSVSSLGGEVRCSNYSGYRLLTQIRHLTCKLILFLSVQLKFLSNIFMCLKFVVNIIHDTANFSLATIEIKLSTIELQLKSHLRVYIWQFHINGGV